MRVMRVMRMFGVRSLEDCVDSSTLSLPHWRERESEYLLI